MSTVGQQFETADVQSDAAKTLHPEDISVGDDLALAWVSYDYPTFMWCGADPALLPPEQNIRLTFLPSENDHPLKVKSVCLPFVLCEALDGMHEVHDVRRVRFMRLSPAYAKAARTSYEKDQKSSKRKQSKTKKKRKSLKSNKKRKK